MSSSSASRSPALTACATWLERVLFSSADMLLLLLGPHSPTCRVTSCMMPSDETQRTPAPCPNREAREEASCTRVVPPPRPPPQAQVRLAHVGCPSPHLVTRKGHQVEGLGEAGGGLLTQVPRTRVLVSQSIAVDWARRGTGDTQGCAGTGLLRLAHALRVLGGT